MQPEFIAESFISDDELAAEALAAQPADPFAGDAVPFDDGAGDRNQLLPTWYMPPASSTSTTFGQKFGAVVCVAAMLGVTGAGLCTTYGIPELPLW